MLVMVMSCLFCWKPMGFLQGWTAKQFFSQSQPVTWASEDWTRAVELLVVTVLLFLLKPSCPKFFFEMVNRECVDRHHLLYFILQNFGSSPIPLKTLPFFSKILFSIHPIRCFKQITKWFRCLIWRSYTLKGRLGGWGIPLHRPYPYRA